MGNSATPYTACTQWFRYDHINGWEFNHIEMGHAAGEKRVAQRNLGALPLLADSRCATKGDVCRPVRSMKPNQE